MQRLHAKLARLVWRMRAVALARRLAACVVWAAGLAGAVVLLDKLVYLGVGPVVVAGVFGLAGLVAAVLLVCVRDWAGRLSAAAAADRVLGLGGRLPSAFELGRSDGPWEAAVVRDAGRHARGIRVREVFPLQPTLATRLVVPAVIAFVLASALPPADLLGRMEREAERRAAALSEARQAEGAIAAAVAQGPAARRPTPGRTPLGALRATLFRIQKGLAEGEMDTARRLELSGRLARLVELMEESGAGPALSEAIRRAGDALAKESKDAAALLHAAEREVARLERELRGFESMPRAIRNRVEDKLAAVGSAGPPDLGGTREPTAAEGPGDDLVELAPRPRAFAGTDVPSQGVVYSRREMGDVATEDYEAAVQSAHARVESGRVPPEHARLVRDYFDSIKRVSPK